MRAAEPPFPPFAKDYVARQTSSRRRAWGSARRRRSKLPPFVRRALRSKAKRTRSARDTTSGRQTTSKIRSWSLPSAALTAAHWSGAFVDLSIRSSSSFRTCGVGARPNARLRTSSSIPWGRGFPAYRPLQGVPGSPGRPECPGVPEDPRTPRFAGLTLNARGLPWPRPATSLVLPPGTPRCSPA
jgi:hypothetical protein